MWKTAFRSRQCYTLYRETVVDSSRRGIRSQKRLCNGSFIPLSLVSMSCSNTTGNRGTNIGILYEPTPNPSSARFTGDSSQLNFRGNSNGSVQYHSSQMESEVSKLAHSIFRKFPEVCQVLESRDFVSCNVEDHSEDYPWILVSDHIENFINENAAAYLVTDSAGSVEFEGAKSISSTESSILEIIDSHVRPNLNLDGGDVEYRGYCDQTKVVRLRLVGSCVGCPSSTATLHFTIRNLLTHMIEEVEGVEQVFDEEDFVGDGSNWTG
mmetsp:Transcript_1478/g.1741  ORF Transcript_1478/g.1741 Transcript_1478/m.1741 type:complete len:267 (+) Transcript_1478:225-1025(+)